jgi:hypothetical protein
MDDRRSPTVTVIAVAVLLAVCASLIGGTARGSSPATPVVVPCADITPPAPFRGQDGTRLVLGVMARSLEPDRM